MSHLCEQQLVAHADSSLDGTDVELHQLSEQDFLAGQVKEVLCGHTLLNWAPIDEGVLPEGFGVEWQLVGSIVDSRKTGIGGGEGGKWVAGRPAGGRVEP